MADSDRIHWTEGFLNARLGLAHLNGVREGVKRTVATLKEKAGDAFKAEQEDEARVLMAAARLADKELTASLDAQASEQSERVDALRENDEAPDRARDLLVAVRQGLHLLSVSDVESLRVVLLAHVPTDTTGGE